MGPVELEAHVLADPFTQHYAVNYLGMVVGTTSTLGIYNLANIGNEINNITEYLPLSAFFQNSLIGVNITSVCEYISITITITVTTKTVTITTTIAITIAIMTTTTTTTMMIIIPKTD